MNDLGDTLLKILKVEGASQYVSQRRQAVFRKIHEIVFHGKGGYDFSTVYNLPIWLRKFIYYSIEEFYRKESEEREKALDGSSGTIANDKPHKIPKEAFKKHSDLTIKRPVMR